MKKINRQQLVAQKDINNMKMNKEGDRLQDEVKKQLGSIGLEIGDE